MSRLSELRIGKSAAVKEVEGLDEISIRLMEMGLIPGTQLTVVGVAPLGDPLEVEVRGYRLSLRRTEAARIQVDASEC
jgi:Fe2+ transport system protein FeoA